MLQLPILKVACVNLIKSWTAAIFHSFSQETDLLMKVIMKCVDIKLWDILGCFHYILNAPRILSIEKCKVTFNFTANPGRDPYKPL